VVQQVKEMASMSFASDVNGVISSDDVSGYNCDNVTIGSYNMHGFNQGKVFLNDLCNFCDIIMLQEHWLLPHDLARINNFCNNFIGLSSSAMDHAISCGVLRGRPHGGIGILVNKRLASCLRCILLDERIIIISIGSMLLVNLYLPTLNSADAYKETVTDILAKIENVIASQKNMNVVIGGDFNFDFTTNSCGQKLFSDFMLNCNLKVCDNIIANSVNYTYEHTTNNCTSFIDHFLVSKVVFDCILSGDILDSGANLSDHLPIVLKLTADSFSNKDSYATLPAPHKDTV